MIVRAIVIAGLSLAASLSAQADPLSLRDAVGLALNHDPAISQAAAILDQHDASIALAQSERNVKLGAQAQLGVLETDFTADRITQTPRQVGLQAEWSFFQSGAVAASIKASRQTAQASEDQLIGTREATILATVEAYANVWLTERVVEVGASTVDTFALRLEETEARIEQGLTTQTDAALTEARLANAEAQQASNLSNLTAAQARLTYLTGVPSPVPPRDFFMALAAPTDKPAFLESAQRNNPNARAARAGLQAATYRQQETEGRFGPKVSLKARATTGEDVYFFFEDPISDVGAFLTVEMPLFTGGQKAASQRQARAGLDQALAQVRQAEMRVEEAAQGLWGQRDAAMQALSAAIRAERATELAAEGAHVEYEAGIRTLVDALDAENAYRDAQANRYLAETRLLIAQASLLALTAELEIALR